MQGRVRKQKDQTGVDGRFLEHPHPVSSRIQYQCIYCIEKRHEEYLGKNPYAVGTVGYGMLSTVIVHTNTAKYHHQYTRKDN